jgi:AmmeMemoRadiSam system protein B
MRRLPACAGQFYEASPAALREQVRSLLDPQAAPMRAKAVVCPHAGLMYSGAVAGAVYSRIKLPPTVILVGPNHTGYGPALSVYPDGEWALPGGVLNVAAELAQNLLRRCVEVRADHLAHLHEHCLEVQLPFLYALRPDIAILPIVVGTRSLEGCLALGRALASLIEEEPDTPPLLIASTDMTHCGPGFAQSPPSGLTAEEFARSQDQIALDALRRLDETRFHQIIEDRDITMCGYAATTAVLGAVRNLGASHATIVRYATSAEVSGDPDRVVGYAGVVID